MSHKKSCTSHNVNNVKENIYISKVKEARSSEELTLILKCAAQWEKAAEGKIKYFKHDTSKRQVAEDAKFVAEGIRYLIKDRTYTVKEIKENEKAVFAAYDNRNKLQGVAFVYLKKSAFGFDNYLDYVIVNPERIKSIGKRPPIKGAGTKLMQAVAKKILQKNNHQNLGLFSLESAVSFYKALGFKYEGSGGGDGPATFIMRINSSGLKKLLAKA